MHLDRCQGGRLISKPLAKLTPKPSKVGWELAKTDREPFSDPLMKLVTLGLH